MTVFEHWWHHEGSRSPSPGQDLEQHTREMCRIAWSNGEYVRSCEQEKLMKRMLDRLKILDDENAILRNIAVKSIDTENRCDELLAVMRRVRDDIRGKGFYHGELEAVLDKEVEREKPAELGDKS